MALIKLPKNQPFNSLRESKDLTIEYRSDFGVALIFNNFDSFAEAKKWKRKALVALQSGLPYETTEIRRLTVGDLIDRFIQNNLKALRNHRTIIGHLQWWKKELGYCILSQFREDLIAKCRDKLKKEPDSLGRSRSPATVNRYLLR